MINVALVSHSPHLHGAERSLVNLAGLFCDSSAILNGKSNQIHPILMVPIPEKGEMSTVAQSEGLDMVYTPPNPWYIYKSPNNTQDFDMFCEKVKDYTKTFIELFTKIKADVVLVNTLTNFAPNIAAFKLGIPTVTWIHGVLDASMIPGIDILYQSVIDREIISMSNKPIYCSKWTEKQFKNIIQKKDSITIPNWTIEPFKHVPYDKTGNEFICLNSMDSKKGINVLVDAAKILKDEGRKFHVSLYGIGYELQNIINQVNALDLNDCVSISPRTTDISKPYNECNALIQPSFYESFGRTTIEAMSYKRPVIAATTADPEKIIVDGKNGFHVEPGNSRQLAEKMYYILNNSKEAENIGVNGYKTFKSRFNGNSAKKDFTKLIYELYKARLKPTPEQQLAFDTLNLIHGF